MSEILHSLGPMLSGVLMYGAEEVPMVHKRPITPQASITPPCLPSPSNRDNATFSEAVRWCARRRCAVGQMRHSQRQSMIPAVT
jgi:hypothetical protein